MKISGAGESDMLDHLLFVYEFNLKHIRYLVEDLTPEQCVHQPSGLINHPAWQVGHLALAANIAAFEMGAEQTIPPEWAERFFPGASITAEVADYPPMAELVDQLASQHARVAELLPRMTEAQLAVPCQMEMLHRRFSRVGDFLAYITTGHEAVHVGQIASWRRAMGIPLEDL
jgi:hypothetical protein